MKRVQAAFFAPPSFGTRWSLTGLGLCLGLCFASPVHAAETSQPKEKEASQTAEKAPAKKTAGPTSQAGISAQQAAVRAGKAAAQGKALVAERLKALAATWKKVEAAQKKAESIEKEADAIQAQTLELEAQARRAASLVEQTEARRSRAFARLKKLGIAEETTTAPKPESASPDGATEKKPVKK